MEYCNFAKVFIARCTKDNNAIDNFNKYVEKDNTIAKEQSFVPQYYSGISITQRYENYRAFTNNYKNLQIPSYDIFRSKCTKMQEYLYNCKYYTNRGKHGEKKKFLEFFSLKSWLTLSENQRKSHQLENCLACQTECAEQSSLHISSKSSELNGVCNKIVTDIRSMTITSPSSTPQTQAKKVVKTVLNVLKPKLESQLNIDFKDAVADALNLQPKLSAAKENEAFTKTIDSTNRQIEESWKENDSDLLHVLSSGKSFQQYDR